jgi:hypothetical protein
MKPGTKKDHIVEMCIITVRGALSNYFQGVTAPGLSYFFEKYFIFALMH